MVLEQGPECLCSDGQADSLACLTQAHPFFNAHTPPLHTAEDWQRLFNKGYEAPFVPPDEDQEDAQEGSGDKKKQPGCSLM